MKILLVGCDLTLVESLHKMFEGDKGYGVIFCSSGQLTLEMTRNFVPDITIIDDHLSDMDNQLLFKQLKHQVQALYSILLVGRDESQRLEQALVNGVDDYIFKPVDEYELKTRIKKAMLTRENRRSLYGSDKAYQEPERANNQTEQEQIGNKAETAAGSRFGFLSGKSDTTITSSFSAQEITDYPVEKKVSRGGHPQKGENLVELPSPSPEQSLKSEVSSAVSRRSERKEPKKRSFEFKINLGSLFSGRADRRGTRSRNSSKKNSVLRSVTKAAANIFFVGLLVIMASLAFFLVQSKLMGGVPSVAGYQMYIVLSGSMNPAFDTGSVVFVRPLDPEEITADDIITFSGSGGGSVLTTHRVVEVEREDGLKFVTRGDANNVNDPNPVPAANIIGKVHGSLAYLGYMMGFAQTRNGLIVLVFVPGLLVIIFELRNIFKYTAEMEKEKKKKEQADSALSSR